MASTTRPGPTQSLPVRAFICSPSLFFCFLLPIYFVFFHMCAKVVKCFRNSRFANHWYIFPCTIATHTYFVHTACNNYRIGLLHSTISIRIGIRADNVISLVVTEKTLEYKEYAHGNTHKRAHNRETTSHRVHTTQIHLHFNAQRSTHTNTHTHTFANTLAVTLQRHT